MHGIPVEQVYFHEVGANEIGLPLQRKAEAQHRSVEEVALAILASALEADQAFPTPEQVVAKIQATPPNPQSLRPASGSLAEALRTAPQDPDFDLATWQQAWAALEAEMSATTRANDLAERSE